VQHESENWLAVAGTGKKRDLVRVLDLTPAGKRQTIDFTVCAQEYSVNDGMAKNSSRRS